MAAVMASNEKVARIGQTLAQNEPYSGGFTSATPQHLPTQSVAMALAISMVQPQGVVPPPASYQAAQPLGPESLQWTSYQTGVGSMWQDIDQQPGAYRGVALLPFVQPWVSNGPFQGLI